jgi:uncharacterized membrane protein
MNRIVSFVLIIAIAFSSCKQGKDDELPVLTNLRVNSTSGQLFVAAGSTITVEVTFQDSRALGKYTLDIEGVFDGSPANKKQDYVPYSLSETFTALNRQDFDLRVFDIPNNATSGLYKVKVTTYDDGGNKSNTGEFDLIITNPSTPEITVINPDLADSWKFYRSDTINLVGGISDIDGLKEIKLSLNEEGKTSIYYQTIVIDTPVTTYNFADLPVPVNIPSDASIGNYRLNISGKDVQGNYGIVRKNVRIDYN